MKILLGGDQYPEYINGAAGFTDRLARGLARRGNRVTALWPSADGAPTSYSEDGVDFVRLRSRRTPRSNGLRVVNPWTVGSTAAAVVDRVRPDIIHIQSHILIGRQLARIATREHYPLVATNHFMPENLLDHVPFLGRSNEVVSRWAWRDLAAVYGLADLITAPTTRAVQLLDAEAGLAAEAISCGIDPDRFTRPNSVKLPRTGPTVLFVGRLETEKRIDELLRAFVALPDSLQARLNVVGTGTQNRALRALARQLGGEPGHLRGAG